MITHSGFSGCQTGTMSLIKHMQAEVNTLPVHTLYERETGLFLALYEAEKTFGKDAEEVCALYHARNDAYDKWNDVRNKAIEELNDTFCADDLIRIHFADGHSEERTFLYAAHAHIYTKSGSCVSGTPLVFTARITLVHRAHSGRIFQEDGA